MYTQLEHNARVEFFRKWRMICQRVQNRGPLETNPHNSTPLREVLVLRLWRSSQRENWVGEVQNVETGQIKYVNSPEQLFKLILELMRPENEQVHLTGKV